MAGVAACASPPVDVPTEGDSPPVPASAFPATVDRVVDGDTFVAVRSGREVRVRVIGVDAPESVAPDRPVECWGREAADRLEELLPDGTEVRASYEDGGPQDRYGRELWDVWLPDGRFLQAILVREGSVEARSYPPHDEHADLLDRLEDEARRDRAGMYGAC